MINHSSLSGFITPGDKVNSGKKIQFGIYSPRNPAISRSQKPLGLKKAAFLIMGNKPLVILNYLC